MTIPTTITTALASLEAQVSEASPLANADHATITALQLNSINLVNSVQSTLTATGNLLESWVAPVDPISMISGVLSVLVAANDQNNLSLMRGIVGRVTSNLEQL